MERLDLTGFIRRAEGLGLISVMVSRHGQEIARHNWDDDCRRNIYSASKSFTSAAVGIAQREGLVSLDERLVDAFCRDLPEKPMMGADADPLGVFRMKRNCNKCFAMLLAGCFLFAAGCGSEGGRSVNSKNAVEDTIQGQIAAEEQKTAQATETVTETVTEADTVKSVPTEAATTK